MNNENLQNYANIVKNNIDGKLDVITSIVYKYDINSILNGVNELKDEEIDNVLEECINNCLEKIIEKKLDFKNYKQLENDVSDISEFFYKSDDNTTAVAMEEADEIAYDLIMKVSNHNNRSIKLPIKIDYIKDYCIHNIIDSKDIKLTLLFIILNLSSVCYCLEHNDYTSANKDE